jgi:hypothetical protein
MAGLPPLPIEHHYLATLANGQQLHVSRIQSRALRATLLTL